MTNMWDGHKEMCFYISRLFTERKRTPPQAYRDLKENILNFLFDLLQTYSDL